MVSKVAGGKFGKFREMNTSLPPHIGVAIPGTPTRNPAPIQQHQPVESAQRADRSFKPQNTGLYSLPLAIFLTENKVPYAVVPGMEVKRSIGISRGKSDRIDAQRIAEYAYLRREKIDLYQLPSSSLLELKSLLTLREKMVTQRAGYLANRKETLDFFQIAKSSSVLIRVQDKMISELDNQIEKVEAEIKKASRDTCGDIVCDILPAIESARQRR